MIDDLFIEKGIFKNCTQIKQMQDGILPLRFSDAQLNGYARNEASKIRSLCPSGICMDFLTDSSFINFDYCIKGTARNWTCFDIYVNGVFFDACGTSSIQQISGEFYFEIPKNENEINRITIYLPQLVELYIRNIRIPAGKFIEPCNRYAKNLLCLGDSITQGMEAYHPSLTYPVLLSRYLEMNLLNQGVGGYVFDQASLDPALSYSPDIITVAYGTNDWGKCTNIDEFRNNCSVFLSKLLQIYSTSNIYVITPLWRKDNGVKKPAGTFAEICESISSICSNFSRIKVINGMELIPHIPEFFGDKCLHPNDEGFMLIAMNLLNKMNL